MIRADSVWVEHLWCFRLSPHHRLRLRIARSDIASRFMAFHSKVLKARIAEADIPIFSALLLFLLLPVPLGSAQTASNYYRIGSEHLSEEYNPYGSKPVAFNRRFTILSVDSGTPVFLELLPATDDPVHYNYLYSIDQPVVSTGRLAAAGALGWGIGLIAGGVAGFLLIDRDVYAAMAPGATVYSAFAGATVGAPLGVHITNRRRGNYLMGVLASAAAGAGGVYLWANTANINSNAASITGLATVVVFQIGLSIAVERRTAR